MSPVVRAPFRIVTWPPPTVAAVLGNYVDGFNRSTGTGYCPGQPTAGRTKPLSTVTSPKRTRDPELSAADLVFVRRLHHYLVSLRSQLMRGCGWMKVSRLRRGLDPRSDRGAARLSRPIRVVPVLCSQMSPAPQSNFAVRSYYSWEVSLS
jgi:hypothetical protein